MIKVIEEFLDSMLGIQPAFNNGNNFGQSYFLVTTYIYATQSVDFALETAKSLLNKVLSLNIYIKTDGRLIDLFLYKVSWHLYFEGNSCNGYMS